uniref:Phlebovirus glycoprotein G2 fusion domain-containing protein n=1 Tax=Acrobeloides nanus TaxID=290746 RepID=A0A914CFM0_9BILA
MMLKDPQHHPMGTIKFKFSRVLFWCKAIPHHFSREVKLRDVSTHLCPKDGCCVGDWCARIKHHKLADEFNGISNKRPGYTYCGQGGSWLSAGCPLPTSSCVPYRNYAQETTDSTIYKIFGCYYEEQVKILIEILDPSCAPSSFFSSSPLLLHSCWMQRCRSFFVIDFDLFYDFV